MSGFKVKRRRSMVAAEMRMRGMLDPGRSCGDCIACCFVLAIDELEKPALKLCSHLCESGNGCSIHKTRPGTCRAYHCTWRYGWGEKDERPDRCGLLVEGANHPDAVLRIWAAPGAKREVVKRVNDRLWRNKQPFVLRSTEKDDTTSKVQFFDKENDLHVRQQVKCWLGRLGDDWGDIMAGSTTAEGSE